MANQTINTLVDVVRNALEEAYASGVRDERERIALIVSGAVPAAQAPENAKTFTANRVAHGTIRPLVRKSWLCSQD